MRQSYSTVARPILFRSALLAAVLLSAPYAALAAAQPQFLSPDQYRPAQILPAPPALGSDAAKAELAELERIEAARSAAQFARAKSDEDTENATIFAEAIGAGFDLKILPATAKVMADVRNDEAAAAAAAKTYFKRNRPWIVDANLKNCSRGDAPDSSYPSGHSTMGYSMAYVLSRLLPEKAASIQARAAEYAENRLVCGMHFRRDIEAGHVLGTAVAVELMENKAFMADFNAASAELHTAHIAAK